MAAPVVYKEFDRADFARFDAPARDKAKSFWSSQGYDCTDHPDEYDVDLVVSGKGRHFFCETEVKQRWDGLKFPFDTLHIPLRKAKFLGQPTVFMVFNVSLKSAGIVSQQYLQSAEIKEVANNRIAWGEKFFDVPVDKVNFFNLAGI